jgi:nucleotide-binding universal stress UspA family protein
MAVRDVDEHDGCMSNPDRRSLSAPSSAASTNGRRRPRGRPGHATHATKPDAERVICAIDDDGLSDAVLATGSVLAEQLGASLTVVHSAHPSVFITGEPLRLAIERGDALLDELTRGYDVDERVVVADEPGRLISGLAQECASMIVIGTRGRTGLRAAILGSVSQEVIANAPCPVVTVSASMSDALPKAPERAGQRSAA